MTPKIFVSYAHLDRKWCEELLDQLGWLRHSGQVEVFEDRQIKAGAKWNDSIKGKLKAADIVICLVSPRFVGSKYCTIDEMKAALASTAIVVPVLIGEVHFAALPLSERQALPKGPDEQLKPINQWRGQAQRDKAWAQVAAAIHALLPPAGGGVLSEDASSAYVMLPNLNNLPRRDTEFTGRADKMEEVIGRLRTGSKAAICGLHGLGGVGKTMLACEVARRLGAAAFPDGIWLLDMRGLDAAPRSAESAMGEMLLALESEQKLPEADAAIRALFAATLRGRRMLLILDNARDRAQVASLLPPEPSSVLVTSRNLIDLGAGARLDLDVMPRAEAKALLAKELGPDRPASDGDLDRLAGLAGDLPLALSALAGAIRQSPARTVPQMIAKLAADPSPGMQAALDSLGLSLDALLADDSALHGRLLELAVMPASFTAEAAAAVWAMGEDAALDALDGLVARSLVQQAGETGAEPRFRLHDLIRDLAGGRLSDEARFAASLRHATFFKDILWRCDGLYKQGNAQILAGLRMFDAERRHIESGRDWCVAHDADDRAARLVADYPNAGLYVIALRLHSREQIVWLEAQHAACRRLGDRRGEGAALGNLGLAWAALGELRKAIGLYAQDLAIAREIGDRRGEGQALGNLGVAWSDLGELRKAIGLYEQQLEIAREIGDRRGEGNALGGLGNAWFGLGELRKAIGLYEQHLEIAREIGDRLGENTALHNLALQQWNAGEKDAARRNMLVSLRIHRAMEDPFTPKVEAWLRERGIDPDRL